MVTISLLVAIVGLVLYLLPITNPKVTETGRIMFAFGLLTFLLGATGARVLI